MRFQLTGFDSDGREVSSESLNCRDHVEAAAEAAGRLRARTGWRRASLLQKGRTVASFPGPARETARPEG